MTRFKFVLGSLLCSVILIAGGSQRAWAAGVDQSHTMATSIPGLSGFRVEEALNDSGEIRALVVYHKRQKIQTLNVCTGEPVPRTGNLGGLAFTDFNFDGYPDLALLVSSVRDHNTYCVWLFNPQTSHFALSKELSQITNPIPEPSKKEIVSNKSEGCAGECFERETYVWSGNRLIASKYVAQSEDPVLPPTEDCRFVRTVKERKNGHLISIGRQRVDQGGVSCEPHHPF